MMHHNGSWSTSARWEQWAALYFLNANEVKKASFEKSVSFIFVRVLFIQDFLEFFIYFSTATAFVAEFRPGLPSLNLAKKRPFLSNRRAGRLGLKNLLYCQSALNSRRRCRARFPRSCQIAHSSLQSLPPAFPRRIWANRARLEDRPWWHVHTMSVARFDLQSSPGTFHNCLQVPKEALRNAISLHKSER